MHSFIVRNAIQLLHTPSSDSMHLTKAQHQKSCYQVLLCICAFHALIFLHLFLNMPLFSAVCLPRNSRGSPKARRIVPSKYYLLLSLTLHFELIVFTQVFLFVCFFCLFFFFFTELCNLDTSSEGK